MILRWFLYCYCKYVAIDCNTAWVFKVSAPHTAHRFYFYLFMFMALLGLEPRAFTQSCTPAFPIYLFLILGEGLAQLMNRPGWA